MNALEESPSTRLKPAAKSSTLAKRRSAIGEPKVWLCALGLTIGIAMVVGLLLLILCQGLAVFWPRPLVELQVKGPDGKPETMVGEVRKIQAHHSADPNEKPSKEWLLYLGNKDANGNAFRYVNEQDIISQSRPADWFVAERTTYGNAIFRPVSLATTDGKTIAASDSAFHATLDKAISEASERRSKIQRVERSQIGSINDMLTSLVLKEEALNRDTGLATADKESRLKEINSKRDTLKAEYQKLADEAGALRKEQNVALLAWKLPNGTERKQQVGELLAIHQPNATGFFGKLGWFFANVWEFLSGEPRESNTEGGIFPAIFGTFVMTLLMSIVVTPLGVIAAIYLREYAKQGFLVRAVRISVNNLAGVPSIVFGVFGVGFFVYMVGGSVDRLFFSNAHGPTFGTGGILWASATLALLTLPVVIVASEEALASVPRGIREAALACGASKWQTIQRIVLPSALPGILTGVILAMARGAGEVAPLMLVGVVKIAPSLPLDWSAPFIHADRKFMHLGFHIYDLGFQSPDSEAAKPMVFATTLLLIVLVVTMNLAAMRLRNHLRKKYAASTF